MIRLYAFTAGLHGPLPDGVDAAPVGRLLAVFGPDTDDPESQGLAVQALLDVADAVLPARFGERFADVEALLAAVAPRLAELEQLLTRVDGCVELVVRAARPAECAERSAANGASYMRARLRSVTADAAAATALHELLQRHARRALVADAALSRLVHDASYLVERPAVDAFATCVRGYAAAHPELELVCTGPWAPASFAVAP